MTRQGYAGSGPGPITPDGCPVELYARLPAEEEPDIIAGVAPARAHILELGAGAGRITHPLLERGFTVTAVDEAPEMLERISGARTVCTKIEVLDLHETFDVVLLGSYLVNGGHAALCDAWLDACRRHVADDGSVLIEREAPGLHEGLPRKRTSGDTTLRIVSSEPVGDGLRSLKLEYIFPDAHFMQTSLSRPLSDAELSRILADQGLAIVEYLTPAHNWVRATPTNTEMERRM